MSDDLQRALAVLFRDGRPMDPSDLAREMAFVHGWLSIGDADMAVTRLQQQGWLTQDKGGIVPHGMHAAVHPPLGWMPRPSNLLEPPPWRDDDVPVPPAKDEPQQVPSASTVQPPETTQRPDNDPRARLEGRLIAFIARASGVERDEVQRRADRKQRALRPCTSWLALALVAREQGLDMRAIVDALSPTATS